MELIRDVVIPLLTIVASGVVASVVTFRLNAGLQRRDLLRSKLEEAYATAHDYCMALTTHFMKYLRVFRGELDINQANDLTIGTFEDADKSTFRRLEMLVAIYVPAANDILARTIALRDQLNAVVREHRRRYERGDPIAHDLIPTLTERIKQLDEIEQDFQTVIVRSARKLQ